MRPMNREDFEIAIICALTLEADAVEALFDETYDKFGHFYGKQSGDQNTYITGRIHRHNVVLCYLPGMGIGGAAAVTANLQVSYTHIQLALLVGICGAVPFPSTNSEIMLGDVIISDSVVQYDFGRQYPDGFRRKSDVREILGRPSQELRAFLAGLQGRKTRRDLELGISEHLQSLQAQAETVWQRPGLVHDVLFEASYRHKHYRQDPVSNCICFDYTSGQTSVCDEAMQKDCNSLGCAGNTVNRRRCGSEAAKPFIHFGTMASANTVMKSGEHRDKIAEREGVIGFEMEGAGVWDNIPCIIIKGVCDYADSHKNKIWQNYAAATAASCTRSFLEHWMPKSQDESRRVISSKSREPLTLPASDFSVSFIHDSIYRDRGVGYEYIGSSGYPESIPYDKAFKKNHIKAIGNTIIRACLIDSLCIRGQISNIPEGRYEVKWIFCFPDLEYMNILPDDCSAWERLYATGFLNDRVSYNVHLWLNDKIESALWPYNLSLSVGTAKANSFKHQILNLKRFNSPAQELLHPQFQETKFSPWELARKRNQGWCEMESDQIVEINGEQNLAFVIWRKYKGQTPGIPGFAFGGIKLCPESVIPPMGQ